MSILVFDVVEPFDYGTGVVPLIQLLVAFYAVYEFLRNSLTYFAKFRFCWI